MTMAWGGLLSPLCGALPVTVGASLSFPEVMAGGGVPGAALCLFTESPPSTNTTIWFKNERIRMNTLLYRRTVVVKAITRQPCPKI